MADAFDPPDFAPPDPPPAPQRPRNIPGDAMLFVDPSGALLPLSPLEAATAGRFGYVPASPQQVEDWNQTQALHEKYGGIGGELKAAGLGAARAASFGLSDVALTGLGAMSPEDIRGYGQENPISSAAGAAAGTIAPLIATMGASAPAEAAGAAAEAAPGVVRTLAGMTGPALAARAGEGITSGLRGSLGSGLVAGMLARGAGSAVEAMAYDAGHLVSEKALGDPNLTAEAALSQMGAAAALGLGVGALGSAVVGTAKALIPKAAGLAAKLHDALDEAPGALEDVLGGAGTGAVAGLAGGALSAVREAGDDLVGGAARHALGHLAGAAGLGAVAGPMVGIAAKYAIPKLGQALGRLAAEGVPEVVGTAAAAGAKGLAAAGLSAADRSAVESLVDRSASEIASSRQAGAPDMTGVAIADDPDRVAVLAQLERGNVKVANEINDGAAAVVSGSDRAASLSGDYSPATFRRRVEAIQTLANAPTVALPHLEALIADTHRHAPNVGQSLALTASRAVAFLASKIPTPPSPKWEPSAAEIGTFNRHWNAVDRPTGVLGEAAAGVLTPEAVESVQTVYPALYAKMREAVFTRLVEHGGVEKVPYGRRLAITQLLGADLGNDLDLGSLLANQSVYSQGTAVPSMTPAPTKPSRSGAGKVTLAKRSLTDQQAAQARGEEKA
ncbi:hypothetical protein [Anaeromyxobacter oryzae]|uniref:Uncharacterized protein n=1 Tax=Anaeromyxobacter oryzae TaxID=2918170 RepID=A0ABN6MVJ8_9BACT|nr:hypothetical protein [Anaeromyxobacter oryzae]BDG04943.1 hypothetical protein AMOR_39390 [Anaeromyxobacter oryzae]